MARAGSTAIVVLAAALGAAVLAQDGRKITGVVVGDGTAAPVVNALVSYEDETSGAAPTTRTDGKGRFEFPYGTQGIVTVNAQNYGTLKRSSPPRQGRELRFELMAPAVLSGSLVDAATGRGVEGLVTLEVHHPLNHVASTALARGSFRFEDLPAGSAIIYAHADGFAPYFSTLRIDAGKASTARLGLMLEAAASGLIVDRDGDPVVGATVYLDYGRSLAGSDYLANLARRDAVSDPSTGAFRIAGLVPDNPVTLQAELDGRVSDTVTVQVGPGMEQPGLTLRMQ